MPQAALLSAVTACLAFTLSEAALFAPWRRWVERHSAWLGKLVSCGYCLGCWIALALVAVNRLRLLGCWPWLDLLLTSCVVAWLAAFQWAALCWLLTRAGK